MVNRNNTYHINKILPISSTDIYNQLTNYAKG